MNKEIFDKESEEIANNRCHEIMCYGHCSFSSPKHHRCGEWHREYKCALKGAELGYNKANEWHKVSDKLPEMDVLVYLWNKINDFPVVACRYIPYGHKEWVWDCKWGSGYEISQSKAKDYFWKEIILPKIKEIKENG